MRIINLLNALDGFRQSLMNHRNSPMIEGSLRKFLRMKTFVFSNRLR
ncbi:hypothetical protein HMPREF0880_04346 [Yokenella regensburgei ATCC 43003]|nr:hypothetical protein HMPREF0880_04346 [Yokenella regensburgei ATCC 43003]